MPPIEIIDLVSSPSPPPSSPPPSPYILFASVANLPRRKPLDRTTPTNPPATSNNVPIRSSPRRRAADAALARYERSKQVLEQEIPKRILEDEFVDIDASSPAFPGAVRFMSGGRSGRGDSGVKPVDETSWTEAKDDIPVGVHEMGSFAISRILPTVGHIGLTNAVSSGGFVDLSDDVEEDYGKQKASPKATTSGKKLFADFLDLSDDVDMSIMDTKPTAPTSAMNTTAASDFFFLSDDFDSTINLEDSFSPNSGDLKKRRASPKPVPNLTKKAKGEESSKLFRNTSAANKSLKRATSDVAARSNQSLGRTGGLKRSKTSILEEDPIVFTSSPDEIKLAQDRREKAKKNREHVRKEDNYSDFEPVSKRSKALSPAINALELSSDAELPDIDMITSEPARLSHVDSQREMAKYKASKSKDQEKGQKARERASKTSAREAEKERKRLGKEAKAKEKQAASEVAKVNTLKTDKKASTPEMIVDLPSGMDKKLVNQVTTFFAPLGVQMGEWDRTGSMKDVIRWRRKIEAQYNDEFGFWEPVPKHIEPQNHVMCIMRAEEFVELSMGDECQDLDAHTLRMKRAFKGCEIIYLIEGLVQWQRKNKNVKNRQFADAVRGQMLKEQDASTNQPRRRKAKQPEYVDDDMVEDSLLRLQVVHGALIHHTGSLVETAQWVVAFTQHISTIPYRQQRMALDTAFCMESGQVKTGDNPEDTFVKMLQEVNRITPSIAYGIAAEYPSVTKLIKAFKDKGSDGKDMLTSLKKSTNRDGAFSEKEIGKAMSRRVWNIFLGMEEGSTNV